MWISPWTRLLDFISPRTCAVCGARLAITEEELCSVCNLHLPRTNFHLHPLDNPLAKMFWGLMPIEKGTALFHYSPQSDTSRLIYALKYFSRPQIGVHMGRLLARDIVDTAFFEGIDVIVPVPLAPKRRRERGYNQSEEIARGIGDATGIRVDCNALKRKTFKTSQTHLHRWQRLENVDKAFYITKQAQRLKGKHVLLVDDIITTGATIVACADAMKEVEGIRFSVVALGIAAQ